LQATNPIHSIFPFLVNFNIGASNKALILNQRNSFAKFKDFLNKTEDKSSVWFKVNEETSASKEDVFWDMIAFLVGGHESSAKTLTTALMMIKKHPEIEGKL